MAQLSIVVFQYSDGSAKFAAAKKNSETKDALEDPIDTKLCSNSVNSTRRPECLAENDFINSVDFAQDGSHTDVADRLHSEDFTLYSPRADL
jgi:hypothetical protein